MLTICKPIEWDISARKIRMVSYKFAITQEGVYPFRDKKNWPENTQKQPALFFPSVYSFLDADEWSLLKFDNDEAAEVVAKLDLQARTPAYTSTRLFERKAEPSNSGFGAMPTAVPNLGSLVETSALRVAV